MRRLVRLGRPRSRGQALVEFALVLIPFLVMLMGIFDLGRAIYINNSLSEAARDIARATSVHLCDNWDAGGTCSTIGNSSQTLGVIATQKTQVPGLAAASATITIDCTDVSDSPVAASECGLGPNGGEQTFIRVKLTVPFQILTFAVAMPDPITLGSSSHIAVP